MEYFVKDQKPMSPTGLNRFTEDVFRTLIWVRSVKKGIDFQEGKLGQPSQVFYECLRVASKTVSLIACDAYKQGYVSCINNSGVYTISYDSSNSMHIKVAGEKEHSITHDWNVSYDERIVFVSPEESRLVYSRIFFSVYEPAYMRLLSAWGNGRLGFWNQHLWTPPNIHENLRLFSILCT